MITRKPPQDPNVRSTMGGYVCKDTKDACQECEQDNDLKVVKFKLRHHPAQVILCSYCWRELMEQVGISRINDSSS